MDPRTGVSARRHAVALTRRSVPFENAPNATSTPPVVRTAGGPFATPLAVQVRDGDARRSRPASPRRASRRSRRPRSPGRRCWGARGRRCREPTGSARPRAVRVDGDEPIEAYPSARTTTIAVGAVTAGGVSGRVRRVLPPHPRDLRPLPLPAVSRSPRSAPRRGPGQSPPPPASNAGNSSARGRSSRSSSSPAPRASAEGPGRGEVERRDDGRRPPCRRSRWP